MGSYSCERLSVKRPTTTPDSSNNLRTSVLSRSALAAVMATADRTHEACSVG